MNICYLGLGSNLKSPQRILRQATRVLKTLPESHLIRYSGLYQTRPWGVLSQPDFYNMVIQLNTRLSPIVLLKNCQTIEKQFGRVRKKKWGSRTLDIDILLFSNKKIDSPLLTIPHPQLLNRSFVLIPLNEIAPDLLLPKGEVISTYLNDPSIV